MYGVLERIEHYKVVPVLKIASKKEALTVLNALNEGGLPCAEITFRAKYCEKAIETAKAYFPDMLIGAGTVITKEQVKITAACGGEFCVSPGFSVEIANACRAYGLKYFPGCITPSEIMRALNYGLREIKFFPAETFGGIKAIQALAAPFSEVRFMPTGGVNEFNFIEYLSLRQVFACGGSWMATEKDISTHNSDEILRKTRNIVKSIRDLSNTTEA